MIYLNMCLAVPSKVISTDNIMATIEAYGARNDVSLLLMPEPVGIGDYVLVHAGFAIQKVDEEAAKDSLGLLTGLLRNLKKKMICNCFFSDKRSEEHTSELQSH